MFSSFSVWITEIKNFMKYVHLILHFTPQQESSGWIVILMTHWFKFVLKKSKD